jgi:hypothetical protein
MQCSMVEQTVVVDEYLRFRTISELDSAGTCVNCVWLQNQLSKIFYEIKSLTTIISLLQKEQRLHCIDLAQSEHGVSDPPNSVSDMLEGEGQCMVHENRQNQEYNSKSACQANFVERNIEEKDQIKYAIPVILNGFTSSSEEVPRNMARPLASSQPRYTSIVNGKSSKEEVSEPINSVTAVQKIGKFYTGKGTVARRQRSQKILIIDDSHVRGFG